MPLFPEIDLSRFTKRPVESGTASLPEDEPVIDLSRFTERPVENGAASLPEDKPVGVIAGLNSSLLHLLANFSPGDLGVCVVDEKLQLSLSLPEWSRWACALVDTMPSMTATENDPEPIVTVPGDERWWLDSVWIERQTGDNNITGINLVMPEGYFVGAGSVPLFTSPSGPTKVIWPDNRGDFTYDFAVDMPPGGLLMEPGAVLELDPSGSGVAATVFKYWILVKRSKLIRSMVP